MLASWRLKEVSRRVGIRSLAIDYAIGANSRYGLGGILIVWTWSPEPFNMTVKEQVVGAASVAAAYGHVIAPIVENLNIAAGIAKLRGSIVP